MEESPATVNIVIADDHAIFREGVRKLLEAQAELRVVGEAADGEETVRVVRQLNPHILLLDLALPRLTGLEALREVSTLGLQTRTIVLTADIEREQIVEALQLGAHGVVMKHSSLDLLLKCIRCVHGGQYWVGQDSVLDLIHAVRQMNPAQQNAAGGRRDFGLTARERQVIALVGAGYTNKDLGRKLGISENTAKHHLTNIFDKLGVSNRLELVLFAVDHRLTNEE
jgi:two-component system, NarL family, nitrate/nitrite response regulator NarL